MCLLLVGKTELTIIGVFESEVSASMFSVGFKN